MSDTPSESESSGDLPDGSAFMALERLSSDQAFVTVDLTDDAVAGYLTDCDLDLYIEGTDTQTSSGINVDALSTRAIWAPDFFGDVAVDDGSANYPTDGNDKIAEILISDSYYSFDKPITVQVYALNCEETGFIYEIEETLN